MKTLRTLIFAGMLIFFLAICFFVPLPQDVQSHHGESHGNSADQYCQEAYVVYKDAENWMTYACGMAEYYVEWSNECYNSNLAVYTAYEYMSHACLGMSIGEFAF